jgi:hypothetical protein
VKKEVLIAIIIGFALGLVITFGIWTANRALKTSAPQEEKTLSEETTTVNNIFSLSINSPEDNSISSEEKIEVNGVTAPKAIVVVLYPEGEKILEADEEGQFSTEITLAGGANEIKVSAYNQEGNEEQKILTVVYSTAEI